MHPAAAKINLDDRNSAIIHIHSTLPTHLARLAATPAHGNRKLTMDQLFLALLFSFFELMIRSLRRIEDRGDFDGRLNLPRLVRSTTSDAMAAADPALLLPVIQDLRRRVPHLQRADPALAGITQQIIAADGTYLTTVVDVAFALRHTKSNGRKQAQVRANFQLDVDSFTPQVVTISGDDHESEPTAVGRELLENALYVVDGNFLDFQFLARLLEKNNDFVLPVRGNAPTMTVLEDRPLTAADVEAGVIADQIVELCGQEAKRKKGTSSPLASFFAGHYRLVTIQTLDRHGKPRTIRLLSNLTSDTMPAHVIGAIYRLRWQIELFFKWFKTFARLDHLLSTSRQGITMQLYVAVIGVLLMVVQSGRRISIYSLAVFSYVANGTMGIDEAMAVIQKRNREREMDRARQAARRAKKKLG